MNQPRSAYIDANALVLFILGSIDPKNIGRHKRLSVYSRNEFNIVAPFIIGNDPRYIARTCPNALTEADNLCQGQPGAYRYKYLQIMQKISIDIVEVYLASKTATFGDSFLDLGLTDTVFLQLATRDDLLITGDSRLADSARSLDIKVIDLKAMVTQRYS